MPNYQAPLRDLQFVIHELNNFPGHYQQLEGCEIIDASMLDSIIEQAAKFAEQEVAPLNAIGDILGCTWKDGQVNTPPGFREAFRQFADNGWLALEKPQAYGGQGLPPSMGSVVNDMLFSANHAWNMYLSLTTGAISTLYAHGDERVRQRFLPALIEGRMTGTMCLTEAHCGSDLGLLRTRAQLQSDGSYHITGSKMFISAGEHDITDNIMHLVLARIEGAPAGVKGISLFAVPKCLLNDDDSAGPANGVSCGSIEHKMGIHGNATCVINFDNSTGYLLGTANRGLNAMFTFINESRLAVAQQGQGHSEASFQGALRYARERLQMRAVPPLKPELAADPIIAHPDIRRMLLTQKAFAEGGRMLNLACAQQVDLLHHGASDTVREAAMRRLALLTPIAKGFLTETGMEAAQLGVQVFGGCGFIRDAGMEQISRDVRITAIYEGTNAIQGIDLLNRKVLADERCELDNLFAEIGSSYEEEGVPVALVRQLRHYVGQWRDLTIWLQDQRHIDGNLVGASAFDYLMHSGYVLLGYYWLRAATQAECQLAAGSSEHDFYIGKRETARFYFQRLLPRADQHNALIRSGSDNLMSIPDAAFYR